MKIFGYIALAVEIIGSVETVIALIQSGTITGQSLYDAIQPSLAGLHSVVPKVNISPDLALSICDAVVAAIPGHVKAV